jgi:phenylalanyl-tRNA synthetase beta chain
MKVLKSWLQDHIVETLPSDEKITEAFVFKSSEVEGVEKIKVNGVDDTVFDLKVLPDRAHYMLSHRGVAYDLCSILGLNLKQENIVLPEKGEDIKFTIESDICKRNTATLITNIKNGNSPTWLKERLEAIGARSINFIVDATNYATFDTGQPLHAFDKEKVKGSLSVRFAKTGETIETLDGKNINLKPHHLVIADENGPLDIAGIKGGKRAEVTNDTKEIILEAANFDSVSIRKTSIEVGIRNDASKRFENEITPYLIPKGISSFINILKQFNPDSKIGKVNDKYKTLPQEWIVTLHHKNVENILNIKIEEKQVLDILNKLGCKNEVKNGVYSIKPPFERLDLIIEQDIIDEIGRIYGLDKIKSIVPKLKTTNEFSQEFLLNEKIKDFLYKKGFSEVMTRTFTNKGDVEVSYPVASDKGYLRTSLYEGVQSSVNLAIKNAPLLQIDEVKVFEIGKIFTKQGEKNSLLVYIKNIKKKQEKEKEKIKVLRDGLINELNIKANILCSIDDTGGIITVNGITVGFTNKVEGVMEIDLDLLVKNINKKLDLNSIEIKEGSRVKFKQFSVYPFITRDIALFVSKQDDTESVKSGIYSVIKKEAGEILVKGPELFDEFEKEGKRSLAFRMIFQSNERTLSDDEVNSYMTKLYDFVKTKGWEVR